MARRISYITGAQLLTLRRRPNIAIIDVSASCDVDSGDFLSDRDRRGTAMAIILDLCTTRSTLSPTRSPGYSFLVEVIYEETHWGPRIRRFLNVLASDAQWRLMGDSISMALLKRA
ncbi:hypothetical protein SAY86_007404 [Trapa natans]|uniref:Uncharacterized protein n=1 Tax=Trapa natans TaxID=22666 RepID=A0AAN7LDE5_TRANT|nr:hypothetical protein SAY86_007404 [Trapa natans]